jgi:CHAT domain-containing protein
MIVSRGDVRAELRVPELFLGMGVDETLLEYPWELMHDGENFLCLKHFLGRFVNVSNPNPAARERPEPLAPGPLRVLLISVPQPQVREAPKGSGKPPVKYDELCGAKSETEAIAKTLTAMGETIQLTDLVGKEATYDKVYTAIKANRYHIVHFNGHAYFNKSSPRLSSLVLFDRDLPAGPIVKFFGARPPALFFMNACETAATQSSGSTWEKRYDIFGLARAFLETGGYLIGSRWKVGDDGAAAFAKQFYESLTNGMPLGQATRDARMACQDASDSSDISWASYLLYGDPRLRFSPVS